MLEGDLFEQLQEDVELLDVSQPRRLVGLRALHWHGKGGGAGGRGAPGRESAQEAVPHVCFGTGPIVLGDELDMDAVRGPPCPTHLQNTQTRTNTCTPPHTRQVLGDELDMDAVRAGQLAPMYFCSAFNQFGVDLFLENFVSTSAPPGPAKAR